MPGGVLFLFPLTAASPSGISRPLLCIRRHRDSLRRRNPFEERNRWRPHIHRAAPTPIAHAFLYRIKFVAVRSHCRKSCIGFIGIAPRTVNQNAEIPRGPVFTIYLAVLRNNIQLNTDFRVLRLKDQSYIAVFRNCGIINQVDLQGGPSLDLMSESSSYTKSLSSVWNPADSRSL